MSAVSRAGAAQVGAVACSRPAGGCSFDLGSWSLGPRQGRRRRKPPRRSDQPATSATRRATPRAARRWRIRQNEEALAEFDKAIAIDPLQCGSAVQPRPALSARKAASAGDRRLHHGQWSDAATGRAAAGRAISYLAMDKSKEAAADLDEAVQADPQNAQAWTTRGRPMNASATRPRPRLPTAARSPSARRTKPRAAAWRAPAAKHRTMGSIYGKLPREYRVNRFCRRSTWILRRTLDAPSPSTAAPEPSGPP